MRKTLEELQKLNSRNLLLYFKAERGRFYATRCLNTCECCGEYIWDLYGGNEDAKIKYNEHESYLSFIKKELDTRGHVKTNTHIQRRSQRFFKSKVQIQYKH